MLKCSFGFNAYLTVNTVSLNLYWYYAASSVPTRTSQRTRCLSTHTLDQLLLLSHRLPHNEHSVSQPILLISCFFCLNAYLTVNSVSLNLYSWSAASSVSTPTSQRTQCLSTYTLDQLLLLSQRVSHSEHSISQPILMLSCFFHLNAHLTAHSLSSTCTDGQLFLRSQRVPNSAQNLQLIAQPWQPEWCHS